MFGSGAVGKAIEVEDKKEGAAIRDSIRKAFIKMSGGSQNTTKVTKKEDILDTILFTESLMLLHFQRNLTEL